MGGQFHVFVIHFETVCEWYRHGVTYILQYFIFTVISLILQKMETNDLTHIVSVHLLI